MRALDQLINSKELNGYWHIEKFPDRSPLAIHVPSTFNVVGRSLKKFGATVEITIETPMNNTAFFVKSIHKQAGKMQMDFSYPPEGIRGTAEFNQQFNQLKGKWKLHKIALFES